LLRQGEGESQARLGVDLRFNGVDQVQQSFVVLKLGPKLLIHENERLHGPVLLVRVGLAHDGS
jgi:hypothetical protein